MDDPTVAFWSVFAIGLASGTLGTLAAFWEDIRYAKKYRMKSILRKLK